MVDRLRQLRFRYANFKNDPKPVRNDNVSGSVPHSFFFFGRSHSMATIQKKKRVKKNQQLTYNKTTSSSSKKRHYSFFFFANSSGSRKLLILSTPKHIFFGCHHHSLQRSSHIRSGRCVCVCAGFFYSTHGSPPSIHSSGCEASEK